MARVFIGGVASVLCVAACERRNDAPVSAPAPSPAVAPIAQPPPSPPDARPDPACATIARIPSTLLGTRVASLGSGLAGLELGRPMSKLPAAFAAWRGVQSYSSVAYPTEISSDPDHIKALAIDGATVIPGWCGDPTTLFRLTIEVPGVGLDGLLRGMWGEGARLADGSNVWTTGSAGARRRVRTREIKCTTQIVYEPYQTVAELFALKLEKYLGMPMRALYEGRRAWRGGYGYECYPADGCGGFFELEPLDIHRGPLCARAGRGRMQRPPSRIAVMQAPLADLQLGDCQDFVESGVDATEAPASPPGDGMSDAGYAQLEDALTVRFGRSQACPNPDGDPRTPIRLSRHNLRVLFTRGSIEMFASDVVHQDGSRADARFEEECPNR